METVARNAGQALARHKLHRAGDLTARSQGARGAEQALDLSEAPLRIECYDVSHHQGAETVASMVVFEDGLPRKSEYRRFAVKGVDGNDDTAAMDGAELPVPALSRGAIGPVRARAGRQRGPRRPGQPSRSGRVPTRTSTAGRSRIDPDTGRPRKFAYPPQLVVVDGGPPQVAAAARALAELGIDDIALVGLAKRLEEVWLPGSEHPVVLPRSSEGLYA